MLIKKLKVRKPTGCSSTGEYAHRYRNVVNTMKQNKYHGILVQECWRYDGMIFDWILKEVDRDYLLWDEWEVPGFYCSECTKKVESLDLK